MHSSLRLLLISIFASVVISCGSSSSSDISAGTFTSSDAVAGLTYTTETQSGTTDLTGKFSYKSGETITFSLGGTTIGDTVAAKAEMTPLDLVTGAVLYTTYGQIERMDDKDDNHPDNIAFSRFSNILTFLQALDEDKNPDNGLYINPGMGTLFANTQIDFAMKWAAFEHDDNENSLLRTKTHQAVTQGILSNAVIPGFGIALDQYYSKQSISHNLAILSEIGYDSNPNGTPNSSTAYTYDSKGNRLTETYVNVDSVTNNYIVTKTYDSNGNKLTKTIDNNSTNFPGVNRTSTYTYDTNGNQLTTTYVDSDNDINNSITTYSYDSNGNELTEATDKDSTNNSGVNNTNTYTYDTNGNDLTRTYVDLDNDGLNYIDTKTYDSNGNQLTFTTDYNATNEPGINNITTYTYDTNGNELTNTFENVDVVTSNRIATRTYDSNGNVLTHSTDHNSTNKPGINSTTTYTYDSQGNKLTSTYENVDSVTNSYLYTYTYDSNGNKLIQTIDNNATEDPGVNVTRTYTYDTNDNQLTYTSVDSDNDINNSIVTYTYDSNGNELTETTDEDPINAPGADTIISYTWVSSTWAAVLFLIDD